MTSGVRSQERLINNNGGFITNAERDSIFFKIQRGVIDAERVVILNQVLKSCDSVNSLQVTYIGIQDIQLKAKDKIITNDKLIISTLKETVKLEVKRGRRRGFWNFLKGAAVGAGVVFGFVVLN